MQGTGAVVLADPMAALVATILTVAALVALAILVRGRLRSSADPLEALFSPERLEAEIAATEQRIAQRGAPFTFQPVSPGTRIGPSPIARGLRRTIGAQSACGAKGASHAETERQRMMAGEWEEVLLLPPPEPRDDIARAA